MGGLVRAGRLRRQDTVAPGRDGGSRCSRCAEHVRPVLFVLPGSHNGVRDRTSPASPTLLPFDHILPDPAKVLELPSRTAVLYATLDSRNFRELHTYLHNAASANSPQLAYVFRPIPPADRDPAKRTYLSGYGVALDLKKMDYLAVDDRLQGSSGTEEEHSTEGQTEEADPIVTLLQQYPMDESVDVTLPLTEEELLGTLPS